LQNYFLKKGYLVSVQRRGVGITTSTKVIQLKIFIMIKIKALERRNPQDNTAANKYYAKAISQGVIDFERLAYLVSNQCTVRESDCYAVLRALEHNVMDELKQGKVVQLGGLGNLQVGVSSHGEEAPEEVDIHSVKKAHMNFRPGAKLRDMLEILKYKLIAS
jgi:predicted histone-like DNA-binding protein